ncbi:MAG: ROK family transcriptional regulator [Terriglobia bacterium]
MKKPNQKGRSSKPPVTSAISPGRPEFLREVNARQLLRLLRLHGPCSRADLARQSGLSAPTVSSAISYLQQKSLVEAVGPGRSTAGRRPSLLRFNSSRGYVAGADIGRSVVRVGLADLDGNLVDKWVTEVPAHNSPDSVARQIIGAIRQLRRRHQIPVAKILALAAGVPGITDPRAGIVLSAPILSHQWETAPLRRILEKGSGIVSTVENDVNLAALGESWRGRARGVQNFVFLSIGTGVGAGIFVDGHLYHGSEWTAGEIGYLYVPGTGETPLALRRRGSLESVIGGEGIRNFWLTLHGPGSKNGRRGSPRIEAFEIFDLAERGEKQARVVLQQTARFLADAITNVCVILNSSLVVFGGHLGTHPVLFEATRKILERNEFSRPELALSSLGREAQLFGALWLALRVADARILPTSVDPHVSHVFPGNQGLSFPVLGLVRPG